MSADHNLTVVSTEPLTMRSPGTAQTLVTAPVCPLRIFRDAPRNLLRAVCARLVHRARHEPSAHVAPWVHTINVLSSDPLTIRPSIRTHRLVTLAVCPSRTRIGAMAAAAARAAAARSAFSRARASR